MTFKQERSWAHRLYKMYKMLAMLEIKLSQDGDRQIARLSDNIKSAAEYHAAKHNFFKQPDEGSLGSAECISEVKIQVLEPHVVKSPQKAML